MALGSGRDNHGKTREVEGSLASVCLKRTCRQASGGSRGDGPAPAACPPRPLWRGEGWGTVDLGHALLTFRSDSSRGVRARARKPTVGLARPRRVAHGDTRSLIDLSESSSDIKMSPCNHSTRDLQDPISIQQDLPCRLWPSFMCVVCPVHRILRPFLLFSRSSQTPHKVQAVYCPTYGGKEWRPFAVNLGGLSFVGPRRLSSRSKASTELGFRGQPQNLGRHSGRCKVPTRLQSWAAAPWRSGQTRRAGDMACG